MSISASHLGLWKLCKRREAFTYRQGRRGAAGDSAEAGKRVHAAIEGYYRGEELAAEATWQNYPIGQLAKSMLLLLPAANDNGILGVEKDFVAAIDGVEFHGVKDLVTTTTVYDHKTTSKPAYAKTAKQLTTDVQRLIYTESEPSAEFFQWTTGIWANSSARAVHARIDRAADRERFKLHVLSSAEEMLSVPADIEPLSLEPTLSACKMFPPKGCPFQAECFPEEAGMLTAISESLRTVRPLPAPTPTQPTHLIDMLFIDCMPLKDLDAPMTSSWDLLAQANRTVADDRGVHHSLLVDYGKGPAMVACEVKALLEEHPVKYLAWESRSTEGRACLTTLVPLARVVIKGIY
jgi:hypothetical protein